MLKLLRTENRHCATAGINRSEDAIACSWLKRTPGRDRWHPSQRRRLAFLERAHLLDRGVLTERQIYFIRLIQPRLKMGLGRLISHGVTALLAVFHPDPATCLIPPLVAEPLPPQLKSDLGSEGSSTSLADSASASPTAELPHTMYQHHKAVLNGGVHHPTAHPHQHPRDGDAGAHMGLDQVGAPEQLAHLARDLTGAAAAAPAYPAAVDTASTSDQPSRNKATLKADVPTQAGFAAGKPTQIRLGIDCVGEGCDFIRYQQAEGAGKPSSVGARQAMAAADQPTARGRAVYDGIVVIAVSMVASLVAGMAVYAFATWKHVTEPRPRMSAQQYRSMTSGAAAR